MRINNRKRVVRLKRLFFLVSLMIAVVALALFLLDFTIYAITAVGVFALWFLFFQVTDYEFIEFSDENNKIVLRYYKAVKFGRPRFNAIEFPQRILQNATFENSVFGRLTDLTLTVRTKRGIAEYPSVSLTGLVSADRRKIQESLLKNLGV